MLNKSLKFRITIATSLLTGLSLIVLGTTGLAYFKNSLKVRIAQQQMLVLNSYAGTMEHELVEMLSLLDQVASITPDDVIGDPLMAERFLQSRFGLKKYFRQGIFLMTLDGKIISLVPGEGQHAAFTAIAPEAITECLAKQQPCISSPFTVPALAAEPYIVMTAAVKDDSGRMVGMLGGAVELLHSSAIADIVTNKLEKSGYFYLFTRDRLMLFHPDRERIMRRDLRPGTNLLRDKAIAGFNGTGETVNSRGIPMLSTFKDIKHTNWIVCATVPLAEAYAPIRQARTYFLFIVLVAGIATTVVMWLMIRFLMNPLESFTRHVSTLAEKSGASRLFDCSTGGEIGALAATFNTMLADLDLRQGELEQSRDIYQALVTSTNEMVVLISAEGILRYISPNCLQLTGYSGEEFYADPGLLESVVIPEDRHVWTKHADVTGGEEGHAAIIYRIHTKDGAIRWIEHVCEKISTEDGTYAGRRGGFRDVTQRLEMEKSLEEQRILATRLLNNATVPLFVLDGNHRVIIWNKACEELTGIAAATIIGTSDQWRPFYAQQRPTLSDLVLDNAIAKMGDYYQKYSTETALPETVQAEGWYHGLGGHDRYVYFDAAPVRDSSGAVVAVIETLHDITAIKQVSTELEQAYDKLKATHQQLLQQEKMASIGQLAAGVAHEINNPMGFIASNLASLRKYLERCIEYIQYQEELVATCSAELLAGCELKRKELKIGRILGDVEQLIDESLDGAERVKKIVTALKSFSRVDEAQESLADLNQCLESTINIIWNELKYKATLNRQYGELPQIKCHPQQLNQVFMNLLVNGAHAIEKQGELTVKSWSDPGNVYVAISDTGCGIPEDLRSRIFEPFFTTKEVGKGTGLGLSISYEIVKKHGGDISVESDLGKGTTFTVRIPVG